jgi:hypothetical protein
MLPLRGLQRKKHTSTFKSQRARHRAAEETRATGPMPFLPSSIQQRAALPTSADARDTVFQAPGKRLRKCRRVRERISEGKLDPPACRSEGGKDASAWCNPSTE